MKRPHTLLRPAKIVPAVLFFASAVFGHSPGQAIDPKNLDPSVDPCIDFYQYANGGWLARTPIPPAFSSWGSFTELAEKNNDILRQILEEAAPTTDAPRGSNIQNIGDFYHTGMDLAAIEAQSAICVKALASHDTA